MRRNERRPAPEALERRHLMGGLDWNRESMTWMYVYKFNPRSVCPAAVAGTAARPAARPAAVARRKWGGSAHAAPSIPRRSIVIKPLPPEFSEITKKTDSSH